MRLMLSLLTAAFLVTEVQAQKPANPSAADAAFQEMLANPTDAEMAFRYAELAVAEGDIYGAISALERILRLNPERADVKVRLGELYELVGSAEVANVYLSSGLASPAVPPDIRARAEELLKRSRARRAAEASSSSFFGTIYGGLRYETNANAGPDSPLVLVGGFPAPLAGSDLEQSDGSAVLSADLKHLYRFDSQEGHYVETGALLFASRQFEESDVNAFIGQVDIGPRFFDEISGNPASFRPYLLGSYFALADETFRVTYGVGASARIIPAPNFLAEAAIEYARLDFYDTDTQPTANLRTGDAIRFNPGATWVPNPGTTVSFDTEIGYTDAKANFQSLLEYGAGLSVTQSFEPVFDWIVAEPWSVTANASFRISDYDSPDPTIDPDVSRRDSRFDVGLALNVPITEQAGISIGVRHTRNNSNLPNYEFNNTAFSVLVNYQF